MKDILAKYKLSFTKLKRDKGAPHKPILLLTIIAGIELGDIKSSHILLNDTLIERFKHTWATLVTTKKYIPNIALPFYHLQGDGFWQLVWKNDTKQEYLVIERIRRSLKCQQECIAYAQLDQDLYDLLCNIDARNALKQTLLNNFLNATS
jgi:putative restriction endonuclease